MQITNKQLESVLSLHVFASTDKVTPILTLLQLEQVGDNLVVYTTDRYCLARGSYPLAQVDLAAGQPVYLSANTAKSFLPMVKKLPTDGRATIGHDRIELSDGSTIQLEKMETISRTFPPVAKMFDTDYDTVPPVSALSIRPDFITKLSKIVVPTHGKHDPKAPWQFRFGQAETGKPMPVLCEPINRDSGEIAVLIQPNLLK